MPIQREWKGLQKILNQVILLIKEIDCYMVYKILAIFWGCVFFTQVCMSQKRNDGFVMSVNGYMIDFAGKKVFQPCEDSTTNIWDALNNVSFGIWCSQLAEVSCESIDWLGDSVDVKFIMPPESKVYQAKVHYFYCSIKICMFFIGNSENDFKLYDTPMFKILHNNREYPLLNFYVRERLLEIVPSDKRDLLLMCEYYRKNGYELPLYIQKLKQCE